MSGCALKNKTHVIALATHGQIYNEFYPSVTKRLRLDFYFDVICL